MAAHQAPPSLGFSRQEHWSGLPFPSPMHEIENESEVAQSCPTLSNPMECSLPGSSIHGRFQARSWSGSPVPSPFQDTNFHLKFQFLSIFIIGNRHCQLFSFKWQVHLLFPPQNVSHTQFWIGCLQSFIQVKHSVLWKEWLVHLFTQIVI